MRSAYETLKPFPREKKKILGCISWRDFRDLIISPYESLLTKNGFAVFFSNGGDTRVL